MKGLVHVLKPGGKLLLLSHGVPEKRKKWITGSWQQTNYGFNEEIEVIEVPKCLMQPIPMDTKEVQEIEKKRLAVEKMHER
jgi:hypothetical protein